MGLKISSFKNAGNTFVDAYAKITDYSTTNNTTKAASFYIEVYDTKGSTNLIKRYPVQHVKIVPGTDHIEQCYNYIKSIIDAKMIKVNKVNNDIANPTLISRREGLEVIKTQLESDELLVFAGAELW